MSKLGGEEFVIKQESCSNLNSARLLVLPIATKELSRARWLSAPYMM